MRAQVAARRGDERDTADPVRNKNDMQCPGDFDVVDHEC
jgi:hypothetical protein